MLNEEHTGFQVESLSSSFIQQIRNEIRSGFGFSPFLGSGISASSGILMGIAFDKFLAHATASVLFDSWDIRSLGWPALPSQKDHENNTNRILQNFELICKKTGTKLHYEKDGPITGFGRTNMANPSDQLNEFFRPLVPRVLTATSEVREEDARRVATLRQTGQLETLLLPISSPNLSKTSPMYVIEAGIRHLFDWRATLEFLATATIRSSSNGDTQLTMGSFDPSVIDSFNRHITEGRKPNLCHTMLAHLSRPLRLRAYLTTNFDSLLEQALSGMGIQPQVLDVRTGGEIPPAFTIKAKSTVLKLHGSLIDTRADFSCDVPPTELDKRRFAEAVLGYQNEEGVRISPPNNKKPHLPSHLLVVGYSGNDRRCVLLMKYLLDLDPSFKLFWVCYSDGDLDHLDQLFFEDEYKKRIVVIQTRRPDLLLYELYQELSFCLPAGGFAYEFIHKIPPRPLIDIHDDHHYRPTKSQQKIGKLIEGQLLEGAVKRQLCEKVTSAKPKGKNQDESILVGSTDREGCFRIYPLPFGADKKGTMTTCKIFEIESNAIKTSAIAFDALQEKFKTCIWLEMQDHPSPRYLADDLFRTLSLWGGFHQSENLQYSVPFRNLDTKGKTDKLKDVNAISEHYLNLLHYMGYGVKGEDGLWQTDIFVFLYGRSVPGGCAAWGGNAWKKHEYEELNLFFQLMTKCGINVLYMPFTESRHKREQYKLENYVPILRKELVGQLQLHDLVDIALFKDKESKDNGNDKESDLRTFQQFYDSMKLYENISGKFSTERLGEMKSSVDTLNTAPNIQKLEPAGDAFHRNTNALINNYFSAPPFHQKVTVANAELDRKEINQKYQFLFALSLFRQSRHVSSFLAEAVFNCPFSFACDRRIEQTPFTTADKQEAYSVNLNIVSTIPRAVLSKDNDLIRKLKSDNWLQLLNKYDAFLSKSGSYVWKYRDARLVIQDILSHDFSLKLNEKADLQRTDYEPGGRVLEFPAQLKSRTHLWIANWYQEAFFSTGHANPIVEAIYHYFQSLIYCAVAKPTRLDIEQNVNGIEIYRKTLAYTAANELRKLIRLGLPWIPLWMNIHDSDPFFGANNGIKKSLEVFITKIKNIDFAEQKFLLATLEHLQDDLDLVHHLIKDRGNNHGLLCGISPASLSAVRSNKDHRNAWASSKQIATSKLFAIDTFKELWWTELRGSATRLKFPKFGELEKYIRPFFTQISDHLESHASASAGNVSDKDLASDLETQRQNLETRIRETKTGILGLLLPEVKDDKISTEEPYALWLAEMFGEAGYAFFKRAKMEVLTNKESDTFQNWQNYSVRAKLVHATAFLHLALRLLRIVAPSHLGLEIELRIKYQSIYGIALAYLNRFFESHRHLNQAMALLSKSPGGLGGLHLAAIRLRRAEVYLFTASCQRQLLQSTLDKADAEATKELERIIKSVSINVQAGDNEGLKRLLKNASTIAETEHKVRLKQLLDVTLAKIEVTNKSELEKVVEGILSMAEITSKNEIEKTLQNVLRKAKAEDKNEAEKLREQTRQFFATLDDVAMNLDHAEDILSGVAHSSMWWGKYRELVLQTYSMLPSSSVQDQIAKSTEVYEPLLFRKRQVHDATIRKLFQKLINTTVGESQIYRRIRCVDFYTKAVLERKGDHDFNWEQTDFARLKNMISTTSSEGKKIDMGVLEAQYLEKIEARIMKYLTD